MSWRSSIEPEVVFVCVCLFVCACVHDILEQLQYADDNVVHIAEPRGLQKHKTWSVITSYISGNTPSYLNTSIAMDKT